MKLANFTACILFTALAPLASGAQKSDGQSTTSTTTSSGSTVVVDGKTNGIIIRKSVVNGQPVDVDVQVIGAGVPNDLGSQIEAQVRAATQSALAAAGGAVDGLAQGFGIAFDDKDNFFLSGMPGRKADRAVVVSSAGLDAKTRAEWQEDLNVMARLLERAASQTVTGTKAHAMGIQLMTIGGGRPASHFYLEGYGAVVQLNVGFPLVPTAKKSEGKKEELKPESEWDKARRELYGASRPNSARREAAQVLATHHTGTYDAQRVEKLKDSLVEALKNAANIRHLKRGENLTLIVTGLGEGSTLTLTVPKSALDDLAKGKLSADDFAKKYAFVTN